MTKEQATQCILDIFFPNGKCEKFDVRQLTYNIASFANEPITELDDFTVGEYFSQVKSHPVRWYLHTNMKSLDTDYSSSDELPEVGFLNPTATNDVQKVEQGSSQSHCCKEEVPETSNGVKQGSSQNATEEYTEEDTGTPTVVFRRRRPMFVRKPKSPLSSDVYRSYIDLISHQTIVVSSSSDEDEDSKRMNEKTSDPQARDVKLYEILSGIKTNVDSNSTKFNVTRRNPLEGAVRAIHRKEFQPSNPLSVKFADAFGQAEGAIDEGGPMRELFRLILKEIKDSIAFTGDESVKIISLNAKALREGLYRDIGVLMAMAIVHGGQWPSYFHHVSYQSFAVGTEQIHPSIEDIPDLDVRHQIQKLKSSTSMDELQECVDTNYALFSISGCLQPLRQFSIVQRDQLVNDLVNFIVVGKNVPAISQFMEGLKAIGVGELVTKFPGQFKEVFCFKEERLTADTMEAVFQKVVKSEEGTNKRVGEERNISYWCDYLMDIEEGRAEITLKELLSFGTGTDQIPFLGFSIDPSLEFSHSDRFPKANTCSMTLKLPVHMNFETFKECMDFGIQNSPGFGMA